MFIGKSGFVIVGATVIGLAGAVIVAQELPIPIGQPRTTTRPEVTLPSPGVRVGSDDVVSPFEQPLVPIGDPCARERAEEARTRAEFSVAQRRFDALDAARRNWMEKGSAADAASRAADAAAKKAGGRWTSTVKSGGKTVTRSGWRTPKYGPAADKARAAADKASAEKKRATDEYNKLGSEAEWIRAKAAHDAAKAVWERAYDALQRCLGNNGDSVSIPGGGSITGGGGGGGGGGSAVDRIINGPVIGIPVRIIVCRDGDTRAKSSERISVKLIDLRRAKIRFDSTYQDAADIGGFTDWLAWIKGGFFEGKKVKDLLEGLDAEELPVGGLLDTIGLGLPDFISYYDKMGDEVIGALRKIGEITARVRKAGDYSIHYPTKPYTLTCTTQEVCRKGTWATEKKFEMKREAGITWNLTKAEFAPNADAAKAVIEKLFRQLQGQNQPELTKMGDFEERCK